MAVKNRNVSESELIEILENRKDELLSIPGVTSCGVGYRTRNGKRTNELCIQCTVEQKLSPEQLEAAAIPPLPDQIEYLGTAVDIDIIERSFTTQYELDQHPAPEGDASTTIEDVEGDAGRTSRLALIAPGCSVSSIRTTAGTMGAVVYDQENGDELLLSNWHVLHGPLGSIGDAIVQPGRLDDPNVESNEIGRLVRSFLGPEGDCAVATVENRPFGEDIIELNVTPRRTATVSLGDRIVKSGRTTAVTFGVVTRVGVTANINYGGSIGVKSVQCFEIGPNPQKAPAEGEVSSGGDSGSLWLIDSDGNDSDVAVGLHFAGESDPAPSAEHALACPIGRVLEILNVSLSPPSPPALGQEAPADGVLARIARLEKDFYGAARLSQDEHPSSQGDEEVSGTTDGGNSVLEGVSSNRDEVRSKVAGGGWEVVWGVTINEPEYAKFLLACVAAGTTGNVGAVGAYFKDYLSRTIDKFVRNTSGIAKEALKKAIAKALKDRGQIVRAGKVGVKGGIATYRRWQEVSMKVPDGTEKYKIHGPFGSWTWGWRPKFKTVVKRIPLPNHHQPYVSFRLF